jgi:hypothetical protein
MKRIAIHGGGPITKETMERSYSSKIDHRQNI